MSLQQVTAPEQYKNQAIIKQLKARKETTVRVSPLNKNDFAPGENMKIRVSDSGYVDWSTAYFVYSVETKNSVAATTSALTPHSESIFRRIQVLTQNGGLCEDYDNRDVLTNAMLRHTLGKDVLESEKSVMGNVRADMYDVVSDNHTMLSITIARPNANTSLGLHGPFITSNMHLGWFGSKNLYPMKYMGQILFDCDFVPLNVLCESYLNATGASVAATETITIKNIELVYTSYEYGDEFDALVREQINSPEGLNLKYDTFISHVDSYGGGNGEINSKINLSSSSLKGIFTLFRSTDTVNQPHPTVPGGFDTGGHNYRFGYNIDNNVNDRYNYQVNNKLYPSFPADVRRNAYPELLKALARFGDVSKGSLVTSLDGASFSSYLGANTAIAGGVQSGSFMLGVNLEQQGEDGTMSGVDTRGNLDVSLKLTIAGGNPVTINHYSHVDRLMKIMPNNEIMIIH